MNFFSALAAFQQIVKCVPHVFAPLLLRWSMEDSLWWKLKLIFDIHCPMTCYRVLPYFRSLKSSRVKSAHTAHATSVFDDMRLDYKIRTRTAASENANHDKMNEIKHQLKVKNMFPIKSDSVPNKVEEKINCKIVKIEIRALMWKER